MRFILRSTGDRDDAMDLFQETWLRAYRAYPSFKPDAGFRPWIFQIAANLCRNHARGRARRGRLFISNLDGAAGINSDLGVGGDHAELLNLKRNLARLPHAQGKALMMRKLGGLEYREIGSALNCSEESARASVYKALKKLKAAR